VVHALCEDRPSQLPRLAGNVARPTLAPTVSRPRHQPQGPQSVVSSVLELVQVIRTFHDILLHDGVSPFARA
jgi:hypothetical protein